MHFGMGHPGGLISPHYCGFTAGSPHIVVKNAGSMSVPGAKAACLINELVVANAFSKG
jgi:hypothetical protein